MSKRKIPRFNFIEAPEGLLKSGHGVLITNDKKLILILKTHPRNRDRVDDVVEWQGRGFLGYKK